jgi:hypothetical protein
VNMAAILLLGLYSVTGVVLICKAMPGSAMVFILRHARVFAMGNVGAILLWAVLMPLLVIDGAWRNVGFFCMAIPLSILLDIVTIFTRSVISVRLLAFGIVVNFVRHWIEGRMDSALCTAEGGSVQRLTNTNIGLDLLYVLTDALELLFCIVMLELALAKLLRPRSSVAQRPRIAFASAIGPTTTTTATDGSDSGDADDGNDANDDPDTANDDPDAIHGAGDGNGNNGAGDDDGNNGAGDDDGNNGADDSGVNGTDPDEIDDNVAEAAAAPSSSPPPKSPPTSPPTQSSPPPPSPQPPPHEPNGAIARGSLSSRVPDEPTHEAFFTPHALQIVELATEAHAALELRAVAAALHRTGEAAAVLSAPRRWLIYNQRRATGIDTAFGVTLLLESVLIATFLGATAVSIVIDFANVKDTACISRGHLTLLAVVGAYASGGIGIIAVVIGLIGWRRIVGPPGELLRYAWRVQVSNPLMSVAAFVHAGCSVAIWTRGGQLRIGPVLSALTLPLMDGFMQLMPNDAAWALRWGRLAAVSLSVSSAVFLIDISIFGRLGCADGDPVPFGEYILIASADTLFVIWASGVIAMLLRKFIEPRTPFVPLVVEPGSAFDNKWLDASCSRSGGPPSKTRQHASTTLTVRTLELTLLGPHQARSGRGSEV